MPEMVITERNGRPRSILVLLARVTGRHSAQVSLGASSSS